MPRAPAPAFEPYEEPTESAAEDTAELTPAPATNARLTAFYLSRDRVLGLLDAERLPAHVLAALQGQNVKMASAMLTNAIGTYLLQAIAAGAVKTLQQLAFEGGLQPGAQFIYNGHVSGDGFGYRNKTPALTLTEKLDAPLSGKKLVFEFSKTGLVNETASTRMAGSTRLFAFGYVADVDGTTIRAVPYVVGDLVAGSSMLSSPFLQTLELRPEAIAQFAGMDGDSASRRGRVQAHEPSPRAGCEGVALQPAQ